MKRLLLLSLIMTFGTFGFAQQRATISKQHRNFSKEKIPAIDETTNFSHETLPAANAYWPPTEEIIGTTFYDLQTNASMQNRIFVYGDGTIGAVWTMGYDFPHFPLRGTGYNYYDGNNWGSHPTVRLEQDRTGWPAYSAWGETGEINVVHYSCAATDGLCFSRREEKGIGVWTQWDFFGPAGYEGLLWPRMTTTGTNHSVAHLMAITKPEENGGEIYQGLNGALLYSRSSDGGDTWEIENVILDGIDSNNYTGFFRDSYEIQAQGDNVAMLIGSPWVDLILMKSIDGGDNWEKLLSGNILIHCGIQLRLIRFIVLMALIRLLSTKVVKFMLFLVSTGPYQLMVPIKHGSPELGALVTGMRTGLYFLMI